MKDNLIVEKSKAFAVRIIRLYQYLCSDKKEFTLSKQILRSGTSIGANVKEAVRGAEQGGFLFENGNSLERGERNGILA